LNAGKKLVSRWLPRPIAGAPWRWQDASDLPTDEAPLRSELFSADQMELHGEGPRAAHTLIAGQAADQLLARLAANESALVDVCKLLTRRSPRTAGSRRPGNGCSTISISSKSRSARPSGTCPRATAANSRAWRAGRRPGCPRVYDIALETIAHGDGRVDTESLSRFVAAYQTVTALKLGELWAIPIMLRLALIENLRRVGVRIAASWDERNLAAPGPTG
jgi:cyclic beta-1,2-glucan synthetase